MYADDGFTRSLPDPKFRSDLFYRRSPDFSDFRKNWPGITVSFLLRPHSYDAYTVQRPPSRPRTSQHAQAPTPDATNDFLFLVLPSPKIEGAGWGGGAQQQQRKSAAAPAAARQGNEINTAVRSNALLTCRLAVF